MFVYAMGLVASITGALFFGLFLPFVPFAIAFGLMFLDEWKTKPRRHLPIYGSGRAHAFEFTRALLLAVEFAKRPRAFRHRVVLRRELKPN
jgi:hypothetical protein